MPHDAAPSHASAASPRPPLTRADWLVPIGLFLLGLVPVLAGIARLVGLATGDAAMEGHARFAAAPIPAVLHIVPATLYTVLGAFQFSPRLRRAGSRWHRYVGRALAPLGIVGTLAGMWMAVTYPPGMDDSPTLDVIRLTAGTAMVGSLVLGMLAIPRRDFRAHEAWMTRAYALGIAAGTQAFIFIPQMLAGLAHDEHTFAIGMAAGWGLNIAVAEVVIRRRAPRARATDSVALLNP